MPTPLTEGRPAPAFTAETDKGETVSLKDFAGKHVVLYFYPKDDTPGCTTEACIIPSRRVRNNSQVARAR